MSRRWAAAMLVCWTAGVAAGSDVPEAIVKIYTVHDRANYYNPWLTYGPRSTTGSGCIIAGRRILTNAHVVSDQTFLQVRRYADAERFVARLLAVSHEADLALLTVDDPRFYEGADPLPLGDLPGPQQEVLVYGFAMGGDALSTTKGVLSRVEHQVYAHSSCFLLAGQIDAAINPGNSGGPVVVDGRVVGVVMQSIPGAENIGYMVPVPVIRHFLDGVERDGRHGGFPSLGIVLQDLENPALRERFGMAEAAGGVLVVRVLPGSPADGHLEVGDVLEAVDGVPVATDGTIEFGPRQRTQVAHLIQRRQVGERIAVRVRRDGRPLDLDLLLHRPINRDWLIPMESYDVRPAYYVFGGVVFVPLAKSLLREYGANWFNAAPKELVAMLSENFPTAERDEVVLALKVLAAEVNRGYHEVANWVVEWADGERVRNLRDLVRIVEAPGAGRFLELRSAGGRLMVLDRTRARDDGPAILARYRIPADRSADLRAAAPSDPESAGVGVTPEEAVP